VYIRSTPTLFQANSKFSQIEQSPANAEQNPAKKKAWISLDFLVGNEPFQWVALTPGAKKSFLSPFLPRGGHSGRIAIARSHRASKDARLSTGYGDAAIHEPRFIRRPGQCTTTSDFRKEKSLAPPARGRAGLTVQGSGS
jgi:hypothetical protein